MVNSYFPPIEKESATSCDSVILDFRDNTIPDCIEVIGEEPSGGLTVKHFIRIIFLNYGIFLFGRVGS
jgi:hypothetical protein